MSTTSSHINDSPDVVTGTGQRPNAGLNHTPRGQVTIADRVIEKIAAQAVRESLGLTTHPKAHLHRRNGVLALRIVLTVPFPTPVGKLDEQVRPYVTSRLAELTGYIINQLDLLIDFAPSNKSWRLG